ncbi:hypothetical protein KO361_02625 [Candidatus Woesearchaeota archaeon]|nr:hypothetical protein [Candidatus Woesearchaeota archaeon]
MAAIEVICRRCGKKAPADEFKVDHVYKLAVCNVCHTGRKKDLPKRPEKEKTLRELTDEYIKKQSKKPERYEILRSKIMEEDDDYLEKAVRKKKEEMQRRKENAVKVTFLNGNKVLYPCQSCKYKFKYDIEKQRPTKCPYCEKPIHPDIEF